MSWRRRLKDIIRENAGLRRLYGAWLVLRWRREFERLGIVESQLRNGSVDAAGEPVPWLPLPVVALLAARMPPDLAVLEYGSGNSTLWWSRRAARVVSVEHDAAFHARLGPQLPANVEYLLAPASPDGAYENAPVRFGRAFDLIVIDGVRRVECMQACLPLLKEDGVVIVDNVERPELGPGLEFLRQQGFLCLEIEGLCSLVAWSGKVMIFYWDGNCLGL